VDRREFLRLGVAGAAAAGLAPVLPAWAGGADGPYGPLRAPDANGIMLPAGFTSIEIARADRPVGRSGYLWPRFPDGGATFDTKRAWIYVSNSEVPNPGEGGVAAIRFDKQGEVVDAYPILTGTQTNCAGGPTPWGTWLSGEEHPTGQIWECDPTGKTAGAPLPALGVFRHEAAAVDPRREHVYLTEDEPDGRLYRFTPNRYPKLDAGALEVAAVDDGGRVTWMPLPDPSAGSAPTRDQVPESTAFNGGEGIWYHRGKVYATTKGDRRVWVYDTRRERIAVLHDPAAVAESPLSAVDNLTVTPTGDVLIAEDQTEEQELVLITRAGAVVPMLRMTGHEGSELAGPAFSPDGRFLYFSSQRGGGGPGITFAVTGPFERAKRKKKDDDRKDALGLPGPVLALTVAGAIWRLRDRDGEVRSE
jgi:secreted PhoX family phosphatase